MPQLTHFLTPGDHSPFILLGSCQSTVAEWTILCYRLGSMLLRCNAKLRAKSQIWLETSLFPEMKLSSIPSTMWNILLSTYCDISWSFSPNICIITDTFFYSFLGYPWKLNQLDRKCCQSLLYPYHARCMSWTQVRGLTYNNSKASKAVSPLFWFLDSAIK